MLPHTRSSCEPKIIRVYMLKNRCQKPPCINMWVMSCHGRYRGDSNAYSANSWYILSPVKAVNSSTIVLIMMRFRVTGGMDPIKPRKP